MNLELHRQIPGLQLAESMMYCYPTAAMNVWSPAIEQVILPAEQEPSLTVEVKVNSGITSCKQYGSWKRKAYRTVTSILEQRKTLDCSGKFIFDARYDTYNNIAHILDHIATCVFFARQVLQEHFQKEIEIHVLVDGQAMQHRLPPEVYPMLGIPFIATDCDVQGEIVTVSHTHLHGIRQPFFEFDFPGYNPDTPYEKIFLPRRGNRSIINNDEVTEFLESQGFHTFYLEDYAIAEQWSIVRNAKAVVAVHGAAQSGLIFNQLGTGFNAKPGSGVKVVGIMTPGWIEPGFRRLVDSINGRWCAVRGQVTPEVLQAIDFSGNVPDSLISPYKDPIKVDCGTIQMALDYLGVSSPTPIKKVAANSAVQLLR